MEPAFGVLGLDWRQHVEMDEGLFRPTDIAVSRMNPGKANRVLGWKARFGLKEIISGMLETQRVDQAIVH